MQPESRKFLFDMDKALRALRQFTAGKSVEIYRDDLLLQSAVERQFQIFGEIVWGTIERDLDQLAIDIQNLLDSPDTTNK